jgi:hypothetical protein
MQIALPIGKHNVLLANAGGDVEGPIGDSPWGTYYYKG